MDLSYHASLSCALCTGIEGGNCAAVFEILRIKPSLTCGQRALVPPDIASLSEILSLDKAWLRFPGCPWTHTDLQLAVVLLPEPLERLWCQACPPVPAAHPCIQRFSVCYSCEVILLPLARTVVLSPAVQVPCWRKLSVSTVYL